MTLADHQHRKQPGQENRNLEPVCVVTGKALSEVYCCERWGDYRKHSGNALPVAWHVTPQHLVEPNFAIHRHMVLTEAGICQCLLPTTLPTFNRTSRRPIPDGQTGGGPPRWGAPESRYREDR